MAKHLKNAIRAAIIIAVALYAPYALNWITGAQLATAVVASAVTTLIGSMTQKGISATAGNFGAKFTTRSAIAPRQIIYGKCRVGGTFAHIETSGTDNHLLHLVCVLSGHEVESIETVRINDVDVTTSSSTISGSTVFAATNTEFTNTDNANNFGSGRLVRFTKKLGAADQAVDGFMDAQLLSMTSNHRFRNCAYVYMQIVYDTEKFSGLPQISFIVKGKKVYDPRTGNTAWSDNPALCVRDYLTDTVYGLRATSDEINDTTNAGGFASAANVCDQSVTLANGVDTETRYTANGFTTMAATGEGVIQGLLSSCAGRITYTNGKFNMFAGASQTPSLTLNDDNILSPVQVITNPSNTELYNTVKSVFVDGDNDFIATDAPILRDSTLLANDTPQGSSTANFIKEFELNLPFTTSSSRAMRLQKIALLDQRQTTTITLLADLKFMRLQPNDWVYVTNERMEFTNKVFIVISTQLEVNEDEGVPVVMTRLTLKETASSVFSFAQSDYETVPASGSSVSTGAMTITAPTGLSGTASDNNSFSVNNRNITLSWTNNNTQMITGTEIGYKKNTESTYSDWGIVGPTITQAVLRGLEAGQTYNIRIRHVSINGTFSAYVTVNVASGGTAYTNIEDGATAGARVGTNLKAVDGVTNLGAVDVINSSLSLGISGTTLILNNGGGNTTLGKANVGLNNLGDLDSSQNSKLNGVEAGADVTANNTAQNINNQGALATQNTISNSNIDNNTIDVPTKVVSGSVGEIGGTSGQNSTDNSQNIEITELVRFIYGDNNKPKHIVGTASTTHNPSVSVGDVMGGSPRFNFNFTTHGYSGNKNYVISVGLDFTGSTTSSSESILAVAMRATTSASNFTSQTESDYIFTDKIASAGSHAAGPHILNAKVSLAGNTQHYIWVFALGDDGISSYKSGFINVFGLND